MSTNPTQKGKKNIGVFFNCSEVRFQRRFCQALAATGKKMGYNILFFMTFEVINDESDFNKMNEKTIKFAAIEHLDAIIIAFDTYDKPSIRKVLEDEIRARATCPVISFRELHDNYYSVTSNANDAIKNLINHLTDVHHCRNIAFMAGYTHHHDSNERLKIYKEVMAEKGLPIYDNYIFYGDMWRYSGEEAFKTFFSDPDHIPQAIMCANDYMARALCAVAIEHGLEIPGDLIITGVDDIAEAAEYQPTLTTISVDLERMAEETIELAEKLINKQYVKPVQIVPAKIMYRDSCGCIGEEATMSFQMQLNQYYETMSHLLGQPHNQTMFQIELDACDSLDDLLDSIMRNMNLLAQHKALNIFLSGHINENGGRVFEPDITEEVERIFSYSNGEKKDLEKKIYNTKGGLDLSVFDTEEPRAVYFSLLHDSTNCFGFIVSEFENLKDTVDQYYFDWILKISLAINKYYMSTELKCLLDQNKKNSLTDFMTNMANRRGFYQWLAENSHDWIKDKEEIVFMSFDLDGLKGINDNLGHEAGDDAITAASAIIRKNCPDRGICARTGGDEYIMVYPSSVTSPDEIISRIGADIDELNAKHSYVFDLSLSMGWFKTVFSESTRIEDCMASSDKKMYEMKKIHHQASKT